MIILCIKRISSIVAWYQILLWWWNSELSFTTRRSSSTILNAIYLSLAIKWINSENSFNWTEIFICIYSFTRSFKPIFEIKLIDCLWWSISHWLCKTIFKILLPHCSAYSYRMPTFFFILSIKRHKSRILNDGDSLRISLNLLWWPWRKLMTLCLQCNARNLFCISINPFTVVRISTIIFSIIFLL